MPALKDDLAAVVRTLVNAPDAVAVEEREEGRFTRLALAVDPEDLGKIIGRQGRTARALRALLDARSSTDGTRYELDILEEDER